MVYDQNNGKVAARVARALVKAGFRRVLVLSGGFDAWKAASYEVATGKPAAKVVYTPKPVRARLQLMNSKSWLLLNRLMSCSLMCAMQMK